MQPSEALGIAAQVAVTLAGFAGIVVVFRPESVHRWTALDRFRLYLLLMNSALPLGYALLGMLLLTVSPPVPFIWRWCSVVAFVAQVLLVVINRRSTQKVPAAEFDSVNKVLFYGIAALATAATALQVVNFARWGTFWPFFALIFVHLIAAIIQFLRLVFLPPQDNQ